MKSRIALWLIVLLFFEMGMSSRFSGVQLGIVERIVGLVLISILYWVFLVKNVMFLE